MAAHPSNRWIRCLAWSGLAMSVSITGFSDEIAPTKKLLPKKSGIAVRSNSAAPVGVEDATEKKTGNTNQFLFGSSQPLSQLQSLETAPIDLAAAFALIGVQNPQFLAAQQRV